MEIEEDKNSCVDEWVDRSNRNNKEVGEWRKDIEKDLKKRKNKIDDKESEKDASK